MAQLNVNKILASANNEIGDFLTIKSISFGQIKDWKKQFCNMLQL